MTHELKIERQWADAKLAGEKPFEIRINDRGFQKGDTVRYTVIDPKTKEHYLIKDDNVSDDEMRCRFHPLEQCDFLITYVREGAVGLQPGYCVYADAPVLRSPVKESPPPDQFFGVRITGPMAEKMVKDADDPFKMAGLPACHVEDPNSTVSTSVPGVIYSYKQ